MRTLANTDGKLLIHEDAVAAIVGLAALDCAGVADTAGRGLHDGLAEILGRNNPGRGVEVELDDERCLISVDIVVVYGARSADVGAEVARRVRAAGEASAGVPGAGVAVHVQGGRPGGGE